MVRASGAPSLERRLVGGWSGCGIGARVGNAGRHNLVEWVGVSWLGIEWDSGGWVGYEKSRVG